MSLFKLFDPFFDPFSFSFDPDLALLLNPSPSPFAIDVLVASLSDRVAALELGLLHRDRRRKWTAEITSPWLEEEEEEEELDRRYSYRWEAEAKGAKGKVKWTEEVEAKRGGFYAPPLPVKRTYTYEISTVKETKETKEKKETKKKKKKGCGARVVEIEHDTNPRTIAIRKAFAKSYIKGKRKELSPQDAAVLIQRNFRAHLARRSQVLCCLRDLAIAKAKLKEIRALFCNFSYRRRIAHDAEERQRFSEKIIVLLLTVDALEGPDYMIRAAKKSMIDELEEMLEVVDPQPGKLNSLGRRKFDLPNGQITDEMISSIEEVVRVAQNGA
ncbi:BAG family molecular chaperone regulator 7-like [Ananas comosus]|uniref:BAG family molecular chaperone regulator 7-like n=2 Tax=Ananas comosus TaxID=4615 RepID=A0A6P5GZX0_ANACO|nr:BAG family molecular chaperone regulator 7-like [Ananas comosus]CAD1831167.1 unnamed protein product [Ananas comosus var. bracteatus]